MDNDDHWEERIEELLGSDTEKTPENFLKWREHLLSALSLPLNVTGIEDFPWEEPYVFGGWSKSEYSRLKESNPSYTDEFELCEIRYCSDSEDLVGMTKRCSDGKVFKIELSWLRASETGTDAHTALNDFSIWHCNY